MTHDQHSLATVSLYLTEAGSDPGDTALVCLAAACVLLALFSLGRALQSIGTLVRAVSGALVAALALLAGLAFLVIAVIPR